MKRKVLWYIVLVFVVTMCQHKLTPLIEIANTKPNFYIILAATVAVCFGPKEGATIGCVCGALCDLHSPYPFGTYALMLFFIGLLSGIVFYSEVKNMILLQIATIAVATFIYEFVDFTVALSSTAQNWLSGMDVVFEMYWFAIKSIIWKEMIYNLVLGIGFYFFVGYVVRPREKDDVVKSYTIKN